jgi:hypothetical protein
LDSYGYHQSQYLESSYKKLTGQSISVFDFALPGLMPSDAYFIVKDLLQKQRHPGVLVYGVGPRDFMDNLLVSPAATDPYRHLSRWGNSEALISRIMPGYLGSLNYGLGQNVYMYGDKEGLAFRFIKLVSCPIVELLDKLNLKELPMYEEHQLLPAYRPWQLVPNQALISPEAISKEPRPADNLDEYKKRYRTINWNTFITQMEFLADVFEEAQKQHTQVVLIEMPITEINKSLIQPQAWLAYEGTIKVLTEAYGVRLINLQNTNVYKTEDFGDTVHLNGSGGKKFLDSVAANLKL